MKRYEISTSDLGQVGRLKDLHASNPQIRKFELSFSPLHSIAHIVIESEIELTKEELS